MVDGGKELKEEKKYIYIYTKIMLIIMINITYIEGDSQMSLFLVDKA
jgi:hypothetical protein